MSRELPRARLKIILAGTTAMGPGKADLLGVTLPRSAPSPRPPRA